MSFLTGKAPQTIKIDPLGIVSMDIKIPRLVIAGLAGDSGKTLVSLGLLAAFKKRGLSISVFKKGPDYIDAAWLSHVSKTSCHNLDSYLIDPMDVLNSFIINSREANISIIEGNRGLFDGKDIHGTHSTAQLAKLLNAPVILVVNCAKSTRTIAAIVKGFMLFDPHLNIGGVILNNISGERHRKIISDSIENICNIPVVGVIPKLGSEASLIPGRHLGLVPPSEFDGVSTLNAKLENIAHNYINIEKLLEIAGTAPNLTSGAVFNETISKPIVRIGYFSDAAFTFYYPENLDLLRANGAELISISSLRETALPDIDALYIGGGFPETHAELLSSNKNLMSSVRAAADKGLPIYAECGGLIYLCKSIMWKNNVYKMAGVFPVELTMYQKPVGHGYSMIEVMGQNPFFEIGTIIRAHEFHYSGVTGGLEKSQS